VEITANAGKWAEPDGARASYVELLASRDLVTALAVGRQVVLALSQFGLPARWNDDPESSIEVTPLDWRKRLVG
jgi:hypothetical protein